MKENLEAKITISSVRGSKIEFISISVKDVSSGLSIIEINMTHEELGKALTGLAACPCLIKYVNTSDNVGKKVETKNEIVQGIDNRVYDKEEFKKMFKEIVLPYEVDGWKADVENSFNHHRRNGDGGYSVTFRRYI